MLFVGKINFLPKCPMERKETIASDPEGLVHPTLYIHVVGANSTHTNSDFTTLLSRLPRLPNLHITFIGFHDKSDLFNDGEHESMFTKRCIWRERGELSGRKAFMSCFRGSYGDFLTQNSELSDLCVFYNTHFYEGGLGSGAYAADLAVLAGNIGRGVIGLVTGSREVSKGSEQ